MDNSKAHSLNTKLTDRILWYDGDSTLPEKEIIKQITNGQSTIGFFVEDISSNIKQYNKLVKNEERIRIKEQVVVDDIVWIIPDEYKTLDVVTYIINKFHEKHPTFKTDRDEVIRSNRLTQELVLYKKYKLIDILRVLIYVINTFQSNNVVWGIGRGSSVSSYILYLIGVHDVDSCEYDLDITDFLH